MGGDGVHDLMAHSYASCVNGKDLVEMEDGNGRMSREYAVRIG